MLKPAARGTENDAPKAKVDKRLFVRLGSDYSWRKLPPCCTRVEVQVELQKILSKTSSFRRVRTGYAIPEKNEILRQRLLRAAQRLAKHNAILEEASGLVAFRILNVTATLQTVDCTCSVDAECISNEIKYRYRKEPIQMRPHGICSPDAQYRNWHALFARDSASSTSLVLIPSRSLVGKMKSANAVRASTPLVVSPALWPIRIAAQKCTLKKGARPPSDVATVGIGDKRAAHVDPSNRARKVCEGGTSSSYSQKG